jgi:hypothetical protein
MATKMSTDNTSLKLWTSQLHKLLEPYFLSGIESIYVQALKLAPTSGIDKFRELLQSIPNWKDDIVAAEVKRIKYETELNDLVDKLFNVIMLETIMIMTGMPSNKKNTVKCPKHITFGNFIKGVYVKIAEHLFTYPQIIESNKPELVTVIHSSIDDTLANLIPLKYILENYSNTETQTVTIFSSKHEKTVTPREIPIQDERIRTVESTKPVPNVHLSGDKHLNKTPVRNPVKQMDNLPNEKPMTNNGGRVASTKPVSNDKEPNPVINMDDIGTKNPQDDSEAYYINPKPLDVFSNRSFHTSSHHEKPVTKIRNQAGGGDPSTVDESTKASTNASVRTSEVKKYAGGKTHDDHTTLCNNPVKK